VDKPHKKLTLWHAAMDLVLTVYKFTEEFPQHEKYGITNQIRRSAVSIPANIAEGAARQTKKEFMQFLHISQGSLSELDTHLELAKRLGYLTVKNWNALDPDMVHIDKMISGLIHHQKKG